MMNMFPKTNSVVSIAPKELFTGVKIDYKRDCKLGVGEYEKCIPKTKLQIYKW